MNELDPDMALLNAAVREAGALALRYFRTDLAVWQKDGGTPVSEADIAVDRHLSERLCTERPDYGWLSEETEDDAARLERARVWVVDPIDGTRAFLQGVPHFCHAAALVENGAPLIAVLFNPAEGRLYEAVAHRGARLNGAPIRVSDRQEISGCRMAAFGPMFKHSAWQQPWPEMAIIQRDSVAWRLALVASGDAHAAMGLNTKNDWDLAAADLIVREAGGVMTTHDGKPLAFNNPVPQQPSFLAAGPSLHAALLARTVDIKLRRRTTS